MLASVFAHLGAVTVEKFAADKEGVTISARTVTSSAACPGCGTVSSRRHGGYRRRLADLAVAGRRAVIDLLVSRFACRVSGCSRKTFVEQVEGLTAPFARRTLPLRRVLERIALALAGRPGARLAAHLAVTTSANSLLRLLRRLPDKHIGSAPRVLGVDDFATRKGHVYATILLDMETGQRVDVLPDRTAETLAAWLRQHPGAEIVARDRAGAYAEAVRTTAPQATQVADRFHVWMNLCEAVEKCVVAHRTCLADPEPETGSDEQPTRSAASLAASVEGGSSGPVPQPMEGLRATKCRQRHAAVHALYDKGVGISAIAEALKLDRKTVRRYAHAATVEQVMGATGNAARRGTRVQPYLAYLHERWNEGCTDAARLCAEIREHGYRGSERTVRRHLQELRASGKPAPPVTDELTVRQATRLLTMRPDRLDEAASLRRKKLLVRCPELETVAACVHSFATMMNQRQGTELGAWLEQAEATELPPLRSLARGIRNDFDAVTNGLTLEWNSGPVEGNVNRIKRIKRDGYGRAGFDLLRLQILHAD